jgi:hypothetical protein
MVVRRDGSYEQAGIHYHKPKGRYERHVHSSTPLHLLQYFNQIFDQNMQMTVRTRTALTTVL